MYKKLLSFLLIFSLIAPDIGRCMDDHEPRQRRQSLPTELKHLPLIEQNSGEQQKTNGDFTTPLTLTELLENFPLEPVSNPQEILLKPEPHQEISPETPPTDLTHSFSSSTSKDSSHSGEMEETEKSITLSSSTESPRNTSSDLAQPEKQQAVLLETKTHPEEIQQEVKKEHDPSVQVVSVPHEKLEKPLDQLPEKEVPKGANAVIHLSQETQEIKTSENPCIPVIKPEGDSTELGSLESSPQKPQQSSSRRNSTDSDGDQNQDTDIHAKPLKDVLLLEHVKPLGTGEKKEVTIESSSFLPIEKVSEDLDHQKSVVSETLNSSQSGVDVQEKKENISPCLSNDETLNMTSGLQEKGNLSKELKPVVQQNVVAQTNLNTDNLSHVTLEKQPSESTEEEDKTTSTEEEKDQDDHHDRWHSQKSYELYSMFIKENSAEKKKKNPSAILTVSTNENTSLLSTGKPSYQNTGQKKEGLTDLGQGFLRKQGLLVNREGAGQSTTESEIFDDWEAKTKYRDRKDKELTSLEQFFNTSQNKRQGSSQKEKKNSGFQSADEWLEDFENPGTTKEQRDDLLINGEGFKKKSKRKEALDKREKRLIQKLVPDFLTQPRVSVEREEPREKEDISIEIESPFLKEGSEKDVIIFDKPKSEFEHLLKILQQDDPEQQGAPSKTKLLDDGYTWKQWLLAFIISALEAGSMPAVYNGGFVYLRDVHEWKFFEWYFKSTLAKTSSTYIFFSTFCDAFPRNLNLLNKAANYLAEEKIDKRRIVLTLTASFFPSLLEAGYLILFELYLMNRTHTHGWENQFAGTAFGLSPFRFTNSMLSNFSALWELQDDFTEWLQTSSLPLAQQFRQSYLHPPLISEKDNLISLHQHRLENFKYSLLGQLSKEEIDDIYDTLLNARSLIEKRIPELDKQDIETAHSFLRLRYLLSLGDEQETVEHKNPASWSEVIGEALVLTAGSPYRLLAMEYIWETAFGLLLPPMASKILGWIFGTLAFPIQTALEFKAMKTYLHDFLWDEGPDGHYSYLKFRAFLKGLCSTQGIIFGGVLTVLCYQLCDIWFPSTWWMLGAPAFIFPEYAFLTNSFNATYNKLAGTAALDLYNQWMLKKFSKEPPTAYKVDYILRLVHQEKNRLKNLSTFVHERLQETLRPLVQEEPIQKNQ